MANLVRIQKLLATWGLASRRTIEKWIEQGRVAIDDEVVASQGVQVDADKPPLIKVDGKLVKRPKSSSSKIFAFHKPVSIVSTLKDDQGRRSISHYLPKGRRLYPVGRLDMNSTGLLLITDNGELTNRLLHPSFKVDKEYVVKIAGATLSREEKARFAQGLELEDGKTSPCKLVQHKDPQFFSVILKEGRKRQVRRMFEKLDRKVLQLHRVRFGPIRLGNLKPGELRPLSVSETKILLKVVGM